MGKFLIVVLWSLLGLMVYFVEPELVRDILIPGFYLPFFLVFFPACWLTLAAIWGNSRRGLLSAVGLSLFLILRIYHLGNVLNLLLIFGILITVDHYFN
ncbi:hypothetical protein KKH13_02050 [Patescibacteria group bacterium]|nr:hypothetical protein [Patescibacteria group bacterium]